MSDQAQPATPAKDPEAVDRSDAQNVPPAYGLPAQLTLKSGTYITLRINQALSSDKSQAGDTFTATLSQPVIVNGVVVAPRGQMVLGRVAEAAKAHGGKDSRLSLEMTSFTLADGSQASIHSQLVAMQDLRTASGAEAGTVIGPAAVMMTHNGKPTMLYPGTALTFNITAPVAIDTAGAPQAFRYASPEDYPSANTITQANTRPARPQGSATYVYGPGYYPGYPYYYPYYPYWGPSFGVGIGFGGFGWGGYGRRWR
jgi:hypothetical protein